jgi:hypothetical protein
MVEFVRHFSKRDCFLNISLNPEIKLDIVLEESSYFGLVNFINYLYLHLSIYHFPKRNPLLFSLTRTSFYFCCSSKSNMPVPIGTFCPCHSKVSYS